MKKKDVKLLEKAIKQWDCYASGMTDKEIFIEDVICPLCIKYRKVNWTQEHGISCYGCPVQIHTGKHNCKGTPFTDWLIDYSLDCIKAEIEFLVSLLPEDHKWRNE